MAKNTTRYPLLLLAFLTAIFSCLVPPAQCNLQGRALTQLYRAKRKANRTIDTSHFRTSPPLGRGVPIRTEAGGQDVGLKELDRITRLPGQPEGADEFGQYGGYVTVDESAGRAMYYYFVEARSSKESRPLLLWLNGGPGCSSLAYGAMQEIGPFRVHSDGKTLFRNRYSWNNAANVLFVESPAGVGFSYSNRTSDYGRIGDRRTAEDNYVFLVMWLERFPEYKGREFYIAGESYAGHYVPQLAHTILLHNRNPINTFINLKGIIEGNAVIDDESDERGMYDYFESHSLISQHTLLQIRNHCNFSSKSSTPSDECTAATDEVDRNIFYIDIYNIFGPLCHNFNVTRRPKKLSRMEFDPCSDAYVYAYMNRPEVQDALHANVTRLDHDWVPCSDILTNWLDSPSTIIPLLRSLMRHGLRVWIFSGDNDGRIPVTSTKYSLKKMNLAVKTPWHPWYLGGEVGGYTEEYEGNLTFATVRAAGHQVPSHQPKRALSLLSHFLSGTPLPDTTRYLT